MCGWDILKNISKWKNHNLCSQCFISNVNFNIIKIERIRGFILLFSLIFFCSKGFSASFNCQSTSLSKIESEICNDSQLSLLDSTLGTLYKLAKEKFSDEHLIGFLPEKDISISQRDWLKKRNKCKTKECLAWLYEDRIEFLNYYNSEYLKIRSKVKLTETLSEITKIDPKNIYDLEILWFRRYIGNDTSRFYLQYFDQIRAIVKFSSGNPNNSGGKGKFNNGCGSSDITNIVYFSMDDSNKHFESAWLSNSNCTNQPELIGIKLNDLGQPIVGFGNPKSEDFSEVFKLNIVGASITFTPLSEPSKNLLVFNHEEKAPNIQSLSTTMPKNISIGMLDTLEFQSSFDRLASMGYKQIKLLTPPLTKDALKSIDILYLPVSWAQFGGEKYNNIENSYEVIHEFIDNGGGIFVEQPNPYKNGSKQTVTPKILPYEITFSYQASPYELLGVDKVHPITKDIRDYYLPYPADDILYASPRYGYLIKGVDPKTSPLLYAEYGRGRIIICTHNPNRKMQLPATSDEIFIRMLNWLVNTDNKKNTISE